MSATLDLILERRRIRRRLALWRILAIVAVVIAVIALIPQAKGPITGSHVARIKIDGIIQSDAKRDEMLEKLASTDYVKALIVAIDSPGGTVAGSEALFVNLRRLAEKKPVVAVMSELAASGGYIAAIAADHIVARGSTLTGSIGVVTQSANITSLLDKVGVSVTRVKSAPLKAEPSLTEPLTPEVIAAQEALIADSFDWFKGLVSERRSLKGAALDEVADGRVFTGRQALEKGLVDAIGDEREARAWLESEHGIDSDMKVIDYDPKDDSLPWPISDVKESMMALISPPELLPRGPRLYALFQ